MTKIVSVRIMFKAIPAFHASSLWRLLKEAHSPHRKVNSPLAHLYNDESNS